MLIVCEGKETERNYFDQLKRDEPTRRHFAITVKGGKGGSRQQVAQFAVDRQKDIDADFDEVWCVMDTEGPEELDAARRALELLNANSITPALSNPAFEIWILAHFERTGTVFLNSDQVIAQLNGHWHKHFSVCYDKSDRRVYQRLSTYTDRAIENAKWVQENHHGLEKCIIECNSATDVYRLVESLRAPSN